MKKIFTVLLTISLVACGPSNQSSQTQYTQPVQQVSALDGRQVYSNGNPVYVNGQPVVYQGGTPVIYNNGQPQVVIVQQPQYYDNTGNLMVAGMVGYMLGGGFSNRGYYNGYGGWTGGNYSRQTIVNKTVINKTYVNHSQTQQQTQAYKPQQRPAGYGYGSQPRQQTQSYKPQPSRSSCCKSSYSSFKSRR